MHSRYNPLIITDNMREERIDEKMTAVVMMDPMDYLRLTSLTTPEYRGARSHLQSIIDEARPLADYNAYAQTHAMRPIFLKIRPDSPEWGEVVGHEGRHRVAAMHKSGEHSVQVTLIITAPTGYETRNTSILDLSRRIKQQFGELGGNFVWDAAKIHQVLEANLQISYQKDPLISNVELSQQELAEILAL